MDCNFAIESYQKKISKILDIVIIKWLNLWSLRVSQKVLGGVKSFGKFATC